MHRETYGLTPRDLQRRISGWRGASRGHRRGWLAVHIIVVDCGTTVGGCFETNLTESLWVRLLLAVTLV